LGFDPTVRKGFKHFTVNVRLTGDLTEAQKEEVVKLGPQFSPVYDLVTGAVPVTVKLAS